jgi:CheY-like chemotaxis protein
VSGVLIVDDDPDIRVILADLLTMEGYPVATVSDGREALSHLRDSPTPCLILLDLMMPVMNGWEFRAEQMKDPIFRSVPTVLFTGVPNPEEEAVSLNVAGFVTKSLEFRKILDLVKRFC